MNPPVAGRGASALYTPELLALAVSLADWPLDRAASHAADARSVTCGSTLRFGCGVDPNGKIDRPGLRVTACAIGQAAAALFIADASGRDRNEIEASRDQLARWLAGEGLLPDWPGVNLLEPARAYPGRHGAIMLAWNAALAALPNQTSAS